MEDRVILRLTDAFDPNTKSDIEVTVTMININYGHNRELLEACRPLGDYSYFVHEVRAKKKTMGSLETAVDVVIEELSDDSLIKPFLMANRSEVKSMFITKYDNERAFAEQRAEGREGRAEGKIEGGLLMLFELVKDGLLTLTQAAERANMPVAEFKLQMEQM